MKRETGIFEKCFDVEMFSDGTGIGLEVLDTIILSKAVHSGKSKVFKIQTRKLKSMYHQFLSDKTGIENVAGNVVVTLQSINKDEVYIKLKLKGESFSITLPVTVAERMLV